MPILKDMTLAIENYKNYRSVGKGDGLHSAHAMGNVNLDRMLAKRDVVTNKTELNGSSLS